MDANNSNKNKNGNKIFSTKVWLPNKGSTEKKLYEFRVISLIN